MDREQIIEAFENSVGSDLDRLRVIAQDMGDRALALKTDDTWKTKPAEIQHCINNALMFVQMASSAFAQVSDKIGDYAQRLEPLESDLDDSDRPSRIFKDIKHRMDRIMKDHADLFPAP